MFDRVIVVDWSAANMPTSPTNRANAVWIGCHDAEGGAEWHHRTRAAAEAQLVTLIDTALSTGMRLLIGCDFAMGYPEGFAARLTGEARAEAVWAWLSSAITDGPENRNNRFEVAARINAGFPEGPGPFWSHPTGQHHPGLPYRRVGIDYAVLGLAETRAAETAARGAKSPWMLFNPGSVGSQSLLGLPMIHRLSQLPGVAVWPFSAPVGPVVLAEVYPSLLAAPVAILANAEGLPADQAQVRLLSRALFRLARTHRLAPLFDAPPEAAEEGWILGAQHAPLLAEALTWE
ncbi:MAG: molybdopterin-guanine dinucleotide biosynthesis protein B [Rhodobacteraceae bacterium]|nr:MAG: molybdopterin-guanine dinucleotide biosynthesis protein B [Paracoccaceae bacterium]